MRKRAEQAGKGFFDDLGGIVNGIMGTATPVLSQVAAQALAHKLSRGSGFFDTIGDIFSGAVNTAAPILTQAALGKLMGGHGIGVHEGGAGLFPPGY